MSGQPPVSQEEFGSVLVSPAFARAVGACLEYVTTTGKEGAFTLQRHAAGVGISTLHLPKNAGQNGGEDPSRRIILPALETSVGAFHSHPYHAWEGRASAAPSHRDLLNVTERPEFGPGYVHGVFGREEPGHGSKALMHMMRVPLTGARDLWDAGHTHAMYFAQFSKTGELAKFFRRYGIGYTALSLSVQGGRAAFDFDGAGSAEQLVDDLFNCTDTSVMKSIKSPQIEL